MVSVRKVLKKIRNNTTYPWTIIDPDLDKRCAAKAAHEYVSRQYIKRLEQKRKKKKKYEPDQKIPVVSIDIPKTNTPS